MSESLYDVVIPTIGRPALRRLLASLDAAEGPLPGNVFVVDDRREKSEPLELGELPSIGDRVIAIEGKPGGPASARNRGWVRSRAPWIAFLDDDVVVGERWRTMLARDLAACGERVAASQGNIVVPLPIDRRPTDWERNVASLQGAPWITADCAYRRDALLEAGGFDERFRRAYREDADLALRVTARGWTIAQGERASMHPVLPADPWISVRLQAGNADDVLMRALHGDDWYARAGSPRGAFAHHVATVASAALALAGALSYLALFARFAWRRIAPGPRDPREIATMLRTSAAIPFAAVYHHVRGRARLQATLRQPARTIHPA